jgi:hypothetical protein
MTELGPPEGEGYDLQRVYAEKLRPFWFRWGDRWWQLPHLRMLDFEVQARVEAFDFAALTANEADTELAKRKVNELFDLLMGAEQGQAWQAVSPRPFGMLLDMIQAWSAHSGAEPGEAPASDGSSGSTGRPSKRTSTGSTASASRRRSPAKKAAAAGTPPGNS